MIDLQRLGFGLELTGFYEEELTRAMMHETDGLTDSDECPPVPEARVSQPGDLWLLGPHRLLTFPVPNNEEDDTHTTTAKRREREREREREEERYDRQAYGPPLQF